MKFESEQFSSWEAAVRVLGYKYFMLMFLLTIPGQIKTVSELKFLSRQLAAARAKRVIRTSETRKTRNFNQV